MPGFRDVSIEQFRLPVVFDGQVVIQTVSGSNLTTGEQAEERWIQKNTIGKGGFGEVWLHEREGGGQLRAVKRLAQVVKGVDFFRELAALSMLMDHAKYFVQFYGWYEDIAKDFVFLAMEYVEGGDLSQYLKTPMMRSQAREITRQLLEGLAIMHGRRICHRDIKPQNVLVASLNPIWVKLADFGVAKVEKNTFLRTTTGTVAYSAPELYGLLPGSMGTHPEYTNAVDMWSLGCLVHEMLTMERPFLEVPEYESYQESTMLLDEDPDGPSADMEMIVDYCRGERGFPGQALKKSGASIIETSFVMALMRADPSQRMSAPTALKSAWFLGERQSGRKAVKPISGSDQRLLKFIKVQRLERFFPTDVSDSLLPEAHQAHDLALALIKRGCSRGTAASLSMLVLYDLVILIGDNDSMEYDQSGERIEQLQRVLNAIAGVYSLARDQGIPTILFLNSTESEQNVTAETVQTILRDHDYEGSTRIGTELKKRVLDKFVLGANMIKPLLVIVITDSKAEGEPSTLLESMIKLSIDKLQAPGSFTKGPQSVAFQFLRIGDDQNGVDLLQNLADDKEIGDYVNFRQVSEFKHAVDSREQWTEIAQILLGAISRQWR